MVDGFVLSLQEERYHGGQSSRHLMSGVNEVPQSSVGSYTLGGGGDRGCRGQLMNRGARALLSTERVAIDLRGSVYSP